jgi:hypothetical protein
MPSGKEAEASDFMLSCPHEKQVAGFILECMAGFVGIRASASRIVASAPDFAA